MNVRETISRHTRRWEELLRGVPREPKPGVAWGRFGQLEPARDAVEGLRERIRELEGHFRDRFIVRFEAPGGVIGEETVVAMESTGVDDDVLLSDPALTMLNSYD